MKYYTSTESPRASAFVPDDLEIKITRENGVYRLRFVERFTYLPDEIRSTAIDNAEHLLLFKASKKKSIKVSLLFFAGGSCLESCVYCILSLGGTNERWCLTY